MMKDTIQHEGIVESVEPGHVVVRIVQQAACGGCKVKELCSQSESKEKLVDVYVDDVSRWRVGDEVTVCGALSMGKEAVRLAFEVPLVIIVAVIFFGMMVLKMSELASVGVTAAVLAVYFYLLYLNRDRMAKRFAFWIEG